MHSQTAQFGRPFRKLGGASGTRTWAPSLRSAAAAMVCLASGAGILACDDPSPTPDAVVDAVINDTGAGEIDATVDAPTGADTIADATSDDAADAAADGTLDVAGDVVECNVLPTLASLQENYFGPSCANFASCHKGATPAGGLDLELDSHAAMVNVMAADPNAAAAGKLLVVPGDADASFVVQKVEGTMAANEGVIMPFNIPEPLDPECRIQALRDWINAGAPAQ